MRNDFRLRGTLAPIAVTLGLSTASLGQQQEPLTVNTATGAVVGAMGNGIPSWLGIPHSAPPVGPLRWKPPQPATPWAMPVKANALPSSYVPAGADGQVHRVADRFGMMAAAGELARELRVVPWPEGEASTAAAVGFSQEISIQRSVPLNVVEQLSNRGVKLHLLDRGGDIAGNGLSELFLTIAAAFAEAERDRIRERITNVKQDQNARGRYLGGKVPFGWRVGDGGALVEHGAEQEAMRAMRAMRDEGKVLRTIAAAMTERGIKISREGVSKVLAAPSLV